LDPEELKSVVSSLTDFMRNKGEDCSVDDFVSEVRVLQATKAFDNKVRMYVALATLFPDGSMDAKSVAEKTKFIEKLISFGGGMPLSQWICGFENYLSEFPVAVKGYAMVLKALYDADVAEEEPLIDHYKGAGGDSRGFGDAQKAAEPFITWLQTADAASSDEDEEDDDDDDSD
jgi:hypothetical protein